MTKISLSIPSFWLQRTDQSVLTEPFSTWLELTEPWRASLGSCPVWTTDLALARTIPDHIKAAGPVGSGLPGVVVGSLQELQEVGDASFVLANGEDAAGYCGRDGSFVLLQALSQLTIPAILRGGIGPQMIAAAKLLNLSEVLVEELVWPAITGLPDAWLHLWQSGQPHETRTFGNTQPIRFWARPGFAVTREATKENAGAKWPNWCREHRATPEHPGPKDAWIPAGGMTGLAAKLDLDGTVAERLRQLDDMSERLVQKVRADWPWQPGRGWAQEVGTTLPISQGPMANVSDVAAFAKEVADHGAFAWLALASTPAAPVEALLRETRDLLPVERFGAGIIGMTTNPMLESHIKLCKEAGVRWILVAAGTVEIALRLQRDGFRTVLHTPAPPMLKAALKAGLTHFVWEGREAGGHVGLLNAASLWQHNVAELGRSQRRDICVLLAGGLGTGTASVIAAVFAAQIEDLGGKAGMQLGSAYLKIREAVASGAITSVYGTALAQTSTTLVVGENSGAPTRLLATKKALDLAMIEQQMIAEGCRISARKEAFEKANFGGLRIAAKAQTIVIDDAGARLEEVDNEHSLQEGLFHMGAGASLPTAETMAGLHHECMTSPRTLSAPSPEHAARTPDHAPDHARISLAEISSAGISSVRTTSGIPSSASISSATTSPDDIVEPIVSRLQINCRKTGTVDSHAVAIVGMGLRVPGAETSEEALWDMLLSGEDAIKQVPANVWKRDLFLNEDGSDNAKSYTDIGGFIFPDKFASRKFRIPPKVIRVLDSSQLLGIELTEKALLDAGYPDDDGARGRTDVILGVAQGGDARVRSDSRVILEALNPHDADGQRLIDALQDQLGFECPIPTEDSMPGELANVAAGRIASVFNFSGANFTTDAACASSLTALSIAADRLRLGRCDWVVSGGIDRNMGIGGYVKFCRLGALSKDGSYPFDNRANGFVMGEGGVIFVLRRLEDALRDGNRIRAIIRGTGLSSDGKGKGITAPNSRGQVLAVQRAWEDAGVGQQDIAWIEAHGTGTQVGDRVEAATLQQAFAERKSPLGIASIKGNIGHLKAAAGAAAVAKTILSFEHDLIPPSGNYREPRAELGLNGEPLYVLDKVEAWGDRPRAVGINSFGFGGTDAHLVLTAGNTALRKEAPVLPHKPFSSYDKQGVSAMLNQAKNNDPLVAATLSTRFSSDAPQTADVQPSDVSVSTGTGTETGTETSTETTGMGTTSPDLDELCGRTAQLVAEATGYDVEEIEYELEFEGDLGIDTVKIAEIMGAVRASFCLADDPDLSLSDVGTVEAVADYVARRMPQHDADVVADASREEPAPQLAQSAPPVAPEVPEPVTADFASLQASVAQLVAEATGYDVEEIEYELEFEGDLGIDTVKIAEIMGAVRASFCLADDPDLSLSDVGTVEAVADYVARRMPAQDTQPEASCEEPAPQLADSAPPVAPEVPEPVTAGFASLQTEPPLTSAVDLDYTAAKDFWHSVTDSVFVTCGSNPEEIRNNLSTCSGGSGALRFAVQKNRLDAAKLGEGLVEGWDLPRWQRSGAAFGQRQAQSFAFLFPGQGTQTAGMLAELRGIDVIEQTLTAAAAILDPLLGVPLERFVSVPTDEERAAIEEQLTQTRFTQPVLLAVEIALYRLLLTQGIGPMVVGGHSLGEFGACVAAGVLSFGDALRLVSGRGQAMEEAAAKIADPGAMVAVAVDAHEAHKMIDDLGIDGLELANQNSPTQTVIGGSTAGIERLCAALDSTELPHKRLNVSHAFHTSIVAAASEPLAGLLQTVEVRTPSIPIFSNVTARLYPDDIAEIENLLAIQLARPVRFVEMIGGMCDMGVAGFIEVGAGRVLSNLAAEITGDRNDDGDSCGAWPTYLPGKNAVDTFAKLWTGVSVFSPPEDSLSPEVASEATQKVNLPADSTESADKRPHMTTIVAPSDRPKRAPALRDDDIVVSGVSVGVPGEGNPFDPQNLAALMRGENRITRVSAAVQERIASFGIERVDKDASGEVHTLRIDRPDQGLKYSGSFDQLPDLTRYGVPKPVQHGLDATSRYAIAAGYEALRDAGWPLIRTESQNGDDKYAARYRLPPELGARTGIVYASVFDGMDEMIRTVSGKQPFSRTFLLDILALAHSHLARFLGITGPAIHTDNACASTVGAITIAQDWIRCGRADRVIIMAADLAGGEDLLPYIGGGFLAVGAASTDEDLERAAQPFGAGREGAIIGSGAVGMVLERAGDCAARGVQARARLMGSSLTNDACHPMKMNPAAIGISLDKLLDGVQADVGLTRSELAEESFFVSHEPFTPAKGGSADSEATALRLCFGENIGKVPVVNIKGYTGHPMGASIEDAIAVLSLDQGWLPKVRNADKQDESLRDLKLSLGEKTEANYALHLAAGFGAQIGWVAYGKIPKQGNRFDLPKMEDWLAKTCGERFVVHENFLTEKAQDHGAKADPTLALAPPIRAGGHSGTGASSTTVPPAGSDLRTLHATWQWQRLDSATLAPVEKEKVYAPLRLAPLGSNDVADLVCDWIKTLGTGGIDALQLPLNSGCTWTRVAAEALASVARCYQHEKQTTLPKIIWTDSSRLIEAVPEIAQSELALRDTQYAIQKWLPVITASRSTQAKEGELSKPEGNWLLVGGGRGITALLAKRWAAAGMHELWLLGRRPEPDTSVAELDDRQIKALVKESLGAKRNPQRFQAEVERLEGDRELAQTLTELRSTGTKIVYCACDISDDEQITQLITTLREAGARIEGVVHAGGIEYSAAIEKTMETKTRQVMAPKLQGTVNMLRVARAIKAKRWVGFGSIAAAVGNAGQSAYAAANGALKALSTSAYDLHPLTVDWTAWGGAGMATRGAIPTLLKNHGVESLDPDAAFARLEDLLQDSTTPPAVMVTRSLGRDLPEIQPVAHSQAVFMAGPSDAFVNHHRLLNEAVFPGVFALEALWRYCRNDSVLSVAFKRAIRFADDGDLPISIVENADSGYVVEHDAQGRVKRYPAYEFHRVNSAEYSLDEWPHAGWRQGPSNQNEIYNIMFHGPNFQVLENACFSQQAAFGRSQLPGRCDSWRASALTIESMFQLAALWGSWQGSVELLPVRVETARPTHTLVGTETGVVRIQLESHVDKNWTFVGEWLDQTTGERITCARFSLRETGRTLAMNTCNLPSMLIETETFAASTEEGAARSTAHSHSARQAWKRGFATISLGVKGTLNVPEESPEPGQPLRINGDELYWSRSHTDGVAAAVCGINTRNRLGVDVEHIRQRPASFWQEITNEKERGKIGALATDWQATAVWTAKEAVAKALGTGLSVPLGNLAIDNLSPSHVSIHLTDDAAKRAEELGVGTDIEVALFTEKQTITAIVGIS